MRRKCAVLQLRLTQEELQAILAAVEQEEAEYGFSVGPHSRYHTREENILAMRKGDNLRERLNKLLKEGEAS